MLPTAVSSPILQPLDHGVLLFDHAVQYLRHDDNVTWAIGAFFLRLITN